MPIDFEDAQDKYSSEVLEHVLRRIMRFDKAKKTAQAILTHNRWERHWRTRWARRLHKFAAWIEIPEEVDTQ